MVYVFNVLGEDKELNVEAYRPQSLQGLHNSKWHEAGIGLRILVQDHKAAVAVCVGVSIGLHPFFCPVPLCIIREAATTAAPVYFKYVDAICGIKASAVAF